jgi:hypothetical protein
MSAASTAARTATRPAVDLADAARAIHAEFHIEQIVMSIRSLAPEDFLILCRTPEIRNLLVDGGRAAGPGFSLSLRAWTRLAHADAVTLPFLGAGVPPHAWNPRTADAILEGSGFVVDVASPTARGDDMSAFRVLVRTADPNSIPTPERNLEDAAAPLLITEKAHGIHLAEDNGFHYREPVRLHASA